MKWFSNPATDTQITHASRLWLYVVAGAILVYLVVPTLIVVPMSFSSSQYLQFPPPDWSLRWYENYFGSVEWMRATSTSLSAAFLTMLVATPLGTLAAYGMFMSRVRWLTLIIVILLTPMIVPLILIGIGVFYAYVQVGLLNTLPGLVLAHSVLAIPLVVLVVMSALQSHDMSQEMVARSLGASRSRAFLLITLPQIRFAVLTGAVLAFLASFDEVIVAMFISGGQNSTLTRNMFLALRDQIDPTIAAISTVIVVITTVLLAIVQIFGTPSRAGSGK